MKNIVSLFLIFPIWISVFAQNETTCDVQKDSIPKPTKNQFQSICQDIWDKEMYEGPYHFGYAYQETLWKISGANPEAEDLKGEYQKVARMWDKYRECFRCSFHTDSVANEKNILKFSIDSGFTVFISEAVKKYNLDVNFIDPADGKTVMDFLKDQIRIIGNCPPVNHAKITEYNRLYTMLRNHGGKHARELK